MSKILNFTLDDEIVLITGGAGILGQNFITAFLEAGAKVATCDISDEVVTKLNSKFKPEINSGRFKSFVADLSNTDNVENLIIDIENQLGPIRHLLNNAATKGSDVGKFMRGPSDFEETVWEEVEKVNLKAPFFLSRSIANRLKHHGLAGSIIMVSSIYGIIAPNPQTYEGSFYLGQTINTPPIYSATKSGIIGLTRYLAAYFGEFEVRVNCITPGGVYSGQNDQFRESYSKRVPLKRMAEPMEMVGAAVFLASPAASYITGANIVVDGGFSIW
jgi:NAD(P)-dependent dehydrogenase (short-subunit alcohol dehydrogenase family)